MEKNTAPGKRRRMMDPAVRRWIYGLMCVIVMLMIFLFSSMTGEGSNGITMKIARRLVESVYPNYPNLSAQGRRGALLLMHHLVRKSGHMTEYLLLSVFVYLFVEVAGRRFPALYSVTFSALYAMTDEWHQSFVSQRSPLWSDVLIDTCGAALGALIAFVILLMLRHRRAEN